MPARSLVFIPAWNEAETVAAVVLDLKREIPGVHVLVVDDGSDDGTADAAHRAGAMVASHPFNLGLGASLQTGYRYAWRHGYETVAHCDADGQHLAAETARLIEAVSSGSCDLALGSRFLDRATQAPVDESIYVPSAMRRMGIHFFTTLLRWGTGQRFTDATSGARAANRRVVALFAARYGADYPELESLTRAVRAGLRVQEVPIVVVPRKAGKSKITPARSLYWIFNGVVSLGVAMLRPRASAPEESQPQPQPELEREPSERPA